MYIHYTSIFLGCKILNRMEKTQCMILHEQEHASYFMLLR